MAIEKINAGQASISQLIHQPQKFTEKTAEQKEDKELSKSAKYMIGATAVAGLVALGVIGHNKGWFSKAEKVAQNLTANNENKPTINPEETQRGFDYFKMELEGGYGLMCSKTGKIFEKILSPENGKYQYIYNHKLENGKNIQIMKIPTQEGDGYNIVKNIIDEDDHKIYSAIFFKDGNIREDIFDLINKRHYINDYKGTYYYDIISTNGSKINTSTESTKIEYEDLEKVRKAILDENLPANYDRLKADHINRFPHTLTDGTKTFFRKGNTKTLTQTLANGWQAKSEKTTEQAVKVYSVSNKHWKNVPVYSIEKNVIDGVLTESESVFFPGTIFNKFTDTETGNVWYSLNHDKTITEKDFQKAKLHVFKHISQPIHERTLRSKFDLVINAEDIDSHKFIGYTKYDEYGNPLQAVIPDFKNEDVLIVTPYKNGNLALEKSVKVAKKDFDFSELIEDRKLFGLQVPDFS